ncbi:olfactory receptor 10A3-like [Poecilia latipinna]|uniref:olfactory receptor 10A3-like n=1 Tax=Poecilia latipinna TaxID=48699 RepID=UPI00072E6D8A|nr:PREDICTED: olfactory receptor 10A3-like [Poecilia latipinna]
MMINSTEVLFFTLTAYFHSDVLKYLYFTVVLVLYVLIISSNVLLIVVICVNRSLHEPMFLFLCSLFVNELYGSLGLFPFLLVQILSDVHIIPAPLCFLQIYCVYTYAHIEFCNLAIMSYDRYLAICRPLQYHALMTPSRIARLVALTWLFPLLESVAGILMTVSLQLCGSVIHKIYCHNHSIVKLACADTTASNVGGIVYMFTIILGIIVLILYSYAEILKVCFSGSKQTQQKALSTCAPHLASLINFSFGCFFDLFQSRVEVSGVPEALRVVLSLYFLTCQPLLNPLLYGLNLSKIRSFSKRLVLGRAELPELQKH